MYIDNHFFKKILSFFKCIKNCKKKIERIFYVFMTYKAFFYPNVNTKFEL